MARITLTNAEHAQLVALGDATLRRIVSETTDQIGLGSFVAVNTDDDGTPTANTPWFTAHPDVQANARQALPVLRARLRWALRTANADAMTALIADVDRTIGEPLSKAEQAIRWRAAGGDDKPILRATSNGT